MKTPNFFLVLVTMAFVSVLSAQSQCLQPTASVIPSHIKFVAGDSVTINASITGTEPINYQWYKLSKGTIEGATSPKYTLHNVTKIDTVYLRVMNKCGKQFSNPVYLELDTTAIQKQVVAKPKQKVGK